MSAKYGWRAKLAGTYRKQKRISNVTRSRRLALPRRITPFLANKRTTQHVYGSQYEVSLTSGTGSLRLFRGNGMYDPDRSGTGHQPYGFDQISALYKYFNVAGSSIRAWFVVATAGHAVLLNVSPDASATTVPTITTSSEMLEMFRGDPVISSNFDGGFAIVSKSDAISSKDIMLGRWQESDNTGTSTADPTNQWTWNVGLFNASAYTVTGHLFVRITYDVTWSEPLEFASS